MTCLTDPLPIETPRKRMRQCDFCPLGKNLRCWEDIKIVTGPIRTQLDDGGIFQVAPIFQGNDLWCFCTDGVSEPHGVEPIMGNRWDNRFMAAACGFHDPAYATHILPGGKDQADQGFYRLLRNDDVSIIEADTMYESVHLFGGGP